MISKQLEVRIGLNNWFIFNYVLLDSFKKTKKTHGVAKMPKDTLFYKKFNLNGPITLEKF